MKDSASIPGVRDFLGQLYGGERQGYVFLVGEATGWRAVPVRLAVSDALDHMAELAVELGDVRATVAIYRDRSSRTAGNVLRARAAMVDLDAADLDGVPVPPSILIRSGGRSKGLPHRHGVWFLDRAVDGPGLAELQRGLRDNTGGDPDWNASAASLIRIPGTEHVKGGKLRRVELEKSDDRRLDPDQLRQLNRPRPKATVAPAVPPTDLPADLSSAVVVAVARRLLEVERGALPREPTGYALAVEARRLGADRDQAERLLLDHYWRPVQAIPRDHAYYERDLLGSVDRAFQGSARSAGADRRRGECERFDPAAVESWRKEALADPSLSSYERQVVVELARRMLGAGMAIVTGGTRSLALALSCQPKTVTHALNGTRRFPGLHQRWLRKARRGDDGAQRWGIRTPAQDGGETALTSAIEGSSNPSVPANCGPVFLPAHDAFAYHALGQSIRSTLSVLAAQKQPASIPELAASPFIHLSERTLAGHLRRAEGFDLASYSDGRFTADLLDLDRKLDQVARDLGTAGLRDRLRRRFALERDLDRKRRAVFGERCAEERQARIREAIGRRSRNHRRRRMLERFGPRSSSTGRAAA